VFYRSKSASVHSSLQTSIASHITGVQLSSSARVSSPSIHNSSLISRLAKISAGRV
jgi:hypothetical protein